MTFDHIKTYGWEAAFRGMRNARMSHDKSDSDFITLEYEAKDGELFLESADVGIHIGPKDLELAKSLCRTPAERKFLRMIHVSFDATASIGFWHDFDTYKIGTVTLSESRADWLKKHPFPSNLKKLGESVILYEYTDLLEQLRRDWVEASDPKLKQQLYNALVASLPCGYEQLRTIEMNYEVCRTIYHTRKNHPYKDFRDLCAMFKLLPYAKELITDET